MQRDASALVLLDWYDPRQGVLTGKVFEYLMSPAPIWVVGGSADSPAARLVLEAGRGVVVGRDIGRIRGAIREMVDARRTELRPNPTFIAELTRDNQARRMLRLLDETVTPLSGPGR